MIFLFLDITNYSQLFHRVGPKTAQREGIQELVNYILMTERIERMQKQLSLEAVQILTLKGVKQ